ncbi:bZIP transcription factor [Pseudohyphozyma bogoriensis]|nr:bZIP transcription factor [Pseudohyphozyma bogoriensis]
MDLSTMSTDALFASPSPSASTSSYTTATRNAGKRRADDADSTPDDDDKPATKKRGKGVKNLSPEKLAERERRKEARMVRNRLAAQASRDRKKMVTKDLEDRIAQLEQELEAKQSSPPPLGTFLSPSTALPPLPALDLSALPALPSSDLEAENILLLEGQDGLLAGIVDHLAPAAPLVDLSALQLDPLADFAWGDWAATGAQEGGWENGLAAASQQEDLFGGIDYLSFLQNASLSSVY